MRKNRLSSLCAAYCAICCTTCFIACEKQQKEYPDIRIGKDRPMDELALNKQTEKRILVSGGNGKYKVNIENSQVAAASMSMDTLKVKGLLEGETFATILSHDKRARLKITVVFPELGVMHTEVELRPGIRSRPISISGGGDLVTLEENDPADIMDMKWEGSTGMLEINPKYEGEAIVTVVSEDGKQRKDIHIKVRPEGELKTYGWYSTASSSYYLIMNNRMIVKRKGVGTWILDTTHPHGTGKVNYGSSYLKIAPIAKPMKGDSISLDILRYESLKTEITKGIHRLYVEEVRGSEVLLRGRGFKFLLPYQK